MAAKHVRAVQEYSKVDNYRSLVVLMTIATDIGANDQPAFTSLKTIARRCRCSINLARKIIDELVELGELIREKKGRYTQYSLNNELIPTQADKVEDDDLQCAPPPKSVKTRDDTDQNNELDHIKKTLEVVSKNQSELYSLVSSIVSQSYHDSIKKDDNHITTVSNVMANSDTKEEKEVRREVEKDSKKGSNAPPHYQNFEIITQGIPSDKKHLKPYIDVIKKIVSNSADMKQMLEIADLYFRYDPDIHPNTLKNYFTGPNSCWSNSFAGKGGDMPYLGHLRSEIGKVGRWAAQGCPPPKVKQSTNGYHVVALNGNDDFYDPTMPKPGEGGTW